MMRRNLLRPGLVLALALALPAVPPARAADYTIVETLATDLRRRLDIVPFKVEIGPRHVLVWGQDDTGTDVLELRDAETLVLLQSRTLEMEVADVIVDTARDLVLLIGGNDDTDRLAILDGGLGPVGAIDLPYLLDYPVLSAGPDGLISIGALRTESSDGYFVVIDAADPSAPGLRRDLRFSEAWRGVFGAWLDPSATVLFVNAAWDARLMALSTGKERILSEFREDIASKSTRTPYATQALLDHMACRAGQGTSFLVADMVREVLSLVDYSDTFQSLDTQSYVEFSLAGSGGAVDTIEGTDVQEPVGLLAAACDQSVILLASRMSTEIDQFARNTALFTLEHVGSITLPFLPMDIAISDDGSFAVAISDAEQTILRLTAAPDDGPSRIIGDPDIRDLQRLLTEIGYQIGSIDGILGARTLRALRQAEARFGVNLDPRGDIPATIGTLIEAFDQRK